MIHLYTHNDLDGAGCAIAAKCAFGEKVDVHYNSVGGLNAQVELFLERPKKNRQLFITDPSVHEANEKGLDDYVRSGGKVKLIDHHKTALHLNERSWGQVRVAYEDGRLASATSLFYDYLIQNRLLKPSKALEEFVELVRLYDTWEWESHGQPKAKRLNDLFYMMSIEEFEEIMLQRLRRSEHFAFDDFEERVLDMEEERIERYVRRKKRETVQTFIAGMCVGIVHADSYHSELGHELGTENPHLDYMAILNLGGKKISFRTIHGHIDVSEIAGRYGGGGHAKASGCPMTEEAYRLYVAEPFTLEPIRADAARNVYNLRESVYGTLYENRKEQKMFVFPSDGGWEIDADGDGVKEQFAAFPEAERYVKRTYAAWLARDEVYVAYLMEHMAGTRNREPASV